ncbi:Scr1 family TA system antitoxin-like transcriptional regulator [Streptomyces sp. NPDC051320]|uniref:Scr1 family TA system antitoxin-like transcriptional regulator n=1 Tax=Streptomyces sp. NPDC051320 TaxID=3154644 RepID=UPI00344384D2
MRRSRRDGGAVHLLTPRGRPQAGYGEFQSVNRLITEPDEVRMLAARYGSIRGQALSPPDSRALIEKLLGER